VECQISGTGKILAGSFWIVRNMFISIALLIFFKRDPAGRLLTRIAKFCSVSREIAKLVKFLNFIVSLKLMLIQ